MLDDIKFVHPKDMQDGKVEVTDRDITTNLPYVPGAHLAFDHHASEASASRTTRAEPRHHCRTPTRPPAWSTTLRRRRAFPAHRREMMVAVDKADAAKFSRTRSSTAGLDPARVPDGPAHRPRPLPRVPHLELPADDAADRDALDPCIDEILEMPDVKERVELYRDHPSRARQIRRCSTVHDNLVVLDLRDEAVIHPTNRFMVYALFPQRTSRCTCSGASSSRTPSSRPASRS